MAKENSKIMNTSVVDRIVMEKKKRKRGRGIRQVLSQIGRYALLRSRPLLISDYSAI